jgi:hypothetical protein
VDPTEEELRQAKRPGFLARLRARVKHPLTADQLRFNKFKLDKSDRVVMFGWKTGFSQIALFVGSGLYFIISQLEFPINYPKQDKRYWDFYLGDLWDRADAHLQNALGVRWWGDGVHASHVWDVARHDTRYVIIGVAARLLVALVTVGLSKRDLHRKPVGRLRVITSPLVVMMLAIAGAAPLIWVFTTLPVLRYLNNYGLFNNNGYLGTWLGAGHWELILIGVVAGTVALPYFKPVAAALQLVSIDNKLAAGTEEKWWWKRVYTPAYLKRFRFLKADSEYIAKAHGKALGLFMATGSIAFLAAGAVGVVIKFFGPAKGA